MFTGDMNNKHIKTLKDLADICDVSTSTVSRVLNNEPGISIKTRETILAAVDKYDFSLKKRRKQENRVQMDLVIVIPEDSEIAVNPFYDINELLNAINSVFNTSRKTIQVQTFTEFKNIIHTDDYCTDGIIFAFGIIENPERELLKSLHIPCIYLNRNIESDNYVSCNHFKGMMRLASHLAESGHLRIGYLGYSGHPINYERQTGYGTALRMYHCDHAEILMKVSSIESISGSTAGFFLNEQCDAVMCFNDNFAIRLINEMNKQGVKIPDDISVTGFDNSPMRDIYKPLITTISLSTFEMGFLAARWLYDNIVNKSARRLRCEIEGELLPGETVKSRDIQK